MAQTIPPQRATRRPHRRAFTIIELMVCLGIITILISILLPAVGVMRTTSAQNKCARHQKELVKAWALFPYDNAYKLVYAGPAAHGWVTDGNTEATLKDGRLWDYLGETEVFQCPEERYGHVRSYSIPGFLNGHTNYEYYPWPNVIKRYTSVRTPARQVVFMEEADPRGHNLGSWVINPADSPTNSDKWIDFVAVHHKTGDNLGFADGHVEFMEYEDARTLNFVNNTAFHQVHPGNKDLKKYQRYYIGAEPLH